MIGLREIRQLEIHGECFPEFGGVHHVHGPEYAGLRLKRSLAAAGGNAQFPQALDHFEQLLAFLFFDHVAEQPSQRAHIATQGRLFVVLGRPKQLIQSLDLIRCPPQRFVVRHSYWNCSGALRAPAIRKLQIAGGHRPPLQFKPLP